MYRIFVLLGLALGALALLGSGTQGAPAARVPELPGGLQPLQGTSTPTVCACPNYQITPQPGATLEPGTVDIGNHCDDCETQITLPFPVRLYDQVFTTTWAGANGTLRFGTLNTVFPVCLPLPGTSYTIFPYWNDLYTINPGYGIYTSISGSAPNRILNIEWRAQYFPGTGSVDFEIRLYEGGQAFETIYGLGTSDTEVGVQRDSTCYTLYGCPGTIYPGLRLIFDGGPCVPPLPSPTPSATATAGPSSTPTTTPPTPGATGTAGPSSTPTATHCAITFTDVDPTNPFYIFIRCLACRGIVSGYADGTFRWTNNVTRGQVAKMLDLAAGYTDPIPFNRQTFEDVPPTNLLWLLVERIALHGVISGYTCGGPGEPCVPPGNRPYFRAPALVTRGQLAKMDAQAANYQDPIPSNYQSFYDVPPTNPFWLYIERVYQHSIISGYDCFTRNPCIAQPEYCVPPGDLPQFLWCTNVTRGQTAKIVANTFYPNCQTPARGR